MFFLCCCYVYIMGFIKYRSFALKKNMLPINYPKGKTKSVFHNAVFLFNKGQHLLPSISQRLGSINLSMGQETDGASRFFRVYSLAKRWQCCSAEFQMSFHWLVSSSQIGHCPPLHHLSFRNQPRNVLATSASASALRCKINSSSSGPSDQRDWERKAKIFCEENNMYRNDSMYSKFVWLLRNWRHLNFYLYMYFNSFLKNTFCYVIQSLRKSFH